MNDTERLKTFPVKDGKVEEVRFLSVDKMEKQIKRLIDIKFGFYRVSILLQPTEKSNIRVVAFLPEKENWNGKFFGTGNGGFAGEIVEAGLYAYGSQGFAVVNTDMGTPKDPDDAIMVPEIWHDFGHRATHLMTVVGKELVEYFYGKAPSYSYFQGGSTGGQQAFSEASRYPEDYDGILAVSPAMDRVKLHTFFIWNWKQINQYKNAGFSHKQVEEWRDALVKEYGTLCLNVPEDQFLVYPTNIKENPMDNPNLQKIIKQLFSEDQQNALRGIYDGPKEPVTGEPIIGHFLPGTEAEMLSLEAYSNKESFAHDFFYPFRWIWGKDFDFMNFDFHKDFEKAMMELSPILDSSNPDLHAFKERGGKIMVIGGSSDAIVPYNGFLEYYQKVIDTMGGMEATTDFFRFFLMPGLSHTFGGNGVMETGTYGLRVIPKKPEYNSVTALIEWVENERVPERLLGVHLNMGLKGMKAEYFRPSYAYPNITKFIGTDSKNPDHFQVIREI